MPSVETIPRAEGRTDRPPHRAVVLEILALLVLVVVLVGFRVHAFNLPLETDECNYAYIGQRLLAGDRLYVDVWDHQPAGVFVLFAGVQAVFGDDPAVFRWMATGFSALSLGLIFLLARRFAGLPAALTAGCLFAAASSDPGTAGEGCNREIYMNTLILAAWWMATRRSGGGRWWLFGAGAALALGSALKTIVAVHWLLLAGWVVWRAIRSAEPNQRRWSKAAGRLVALGAAPLLLWVGTTVYFAATDRLSEFVDAVFLFNVGYSEGSGVFLSRFAGFFRPERHPFIFDSALPIWLGAIPASVWLCIRWRDRRLMVGMLLLLLLASYIAVCLPARFWPHYYYLMIPPLVLTVGVAVADFSHRLGHRMTGAGGGLKNRLLCLAVCALVPCLLGFTEYKSYISASLFDITVKRYNSRDFWGRGQGLNVKSVTDPDDTIFVFGSDAALYYYSERRCASRYTMITGLGEHAVGAERRRKILMQDLERNRPRLIVVLFDEDPFDEWRSFLKEYYTEPVGWDLHDKNRKPIMFVVARKDRPIASIDWDWDRSSLTGTMANREEEPHTGRD